MSTLILVPAYGKDYQTESEVMESWNAGNDFIIRTLNVRGTYASIRDLDSIKEAFSLVYIRYDKGNQIAVVYDNQSDSSNDEYLD